ncbi:putative transporter fused subunits of ABC superfamily: ATP-binding components [uncultured Desulfobacterium sp.]|uniref:Putative transporter fused subunits of ABC superfamily: ATP-binding components n=1 Tax=uncultured Desulfobacterium sp. TaxID=201089 RepID=A0A445N3S6_9BACT|nr:putative transporter fused subunits of ABC superfamily: ATP-binding components [uncultured Desulfobacterium sp.]
MQPDEINSSNEQKAIEAGSVSKGFKIKGRVVQALDSVSFDVKRGIVTGLIGPDSAGKTTLMRLIAGLLLPDAGSINVFDVDVGVDPIKVQEIISYMPQRFGLYEDLTVQQNLDLYADLQGVPVGRRAERYAELMHMTGLLPFTARLAGRLSGGMKQKLGLACTLVRAPRLLLLDEPTVGVDPVSRRELWAIVYRLVEEEGMTVLLSTSYLDEAERCADVILIHQGKILGQDGPKGFSAPMSGRSFQVTAPDINKRFLQGRLANAPGVVDAIIHGGGIRVVVEGGADPVKLGISAELAGSRITPVSPRFEDRFVDMLRRQRPERPSSEAAPFARASGLQGEDVIVVKNVKRRFGDFYAVRDVSFSVKQGEVFGLLGANGAGKSTTFRMLCGLLPPSEGALQVAGEDLRRAAASARGRIGYMAQRFSLYEDLSVMENLRFFSSAYGLYGTRQRARIDWAMEEFELSKYTDFRSGDLPLGYKQRLALSAAMMHEPRILFLDEPTSGVDPLARREFWRRINALSEEGVTVLVTTHFMEEAEYCDRLVIMAEGIILAQGTPEEMRENFRSQDRPEPSLEDAFIGLIEMQQNLV